MKKTPAKSDFAGVFSCQPGEWLLGSFGRVVCGLQSQFGHLGQVSLRLLIVPEPVESDPSVVVRL